MKETEVSIPMCAALEILKFILKNTQIVVVKFYFTHEINIPVVKNFKENYLGLNLNY